MQRFLRLLLTYLVIIGSFCAFSNVVLGATLPTKLQAALFKKIFLYDKVLHGKEGDSLKVLVATTSDFNQDPDELVTAFKAVGISAQKMGVNEIANNIASAAAVYIHGHIAPDSIKALCANRSVLSISGYSELAESGSVSIALGIAKGRPEIIVNMKRLKIDGHEISSDLLALARVIK
ncbi:MAG: DUF4154 domain-containing protein [Deltaproteobacteria bacterium]|nr:DUF4154 domain-containing protein [Deltaproteobacteria bacterium]